METLLCILCLAATLQGAVLQEQIGSCSSKQCPGRQTCIEEVKNCPEDRPDCERRTVEPLCVTMEISRSPSGCDDVVCAQSKSCVVLQTAGGTKAACKDVPTSCEEIVCDDGMLCVERMTPRCIPIHTEVVPSNCTQLECSENLVCVVLDGDRGARCAKPPVPTSCEELDCRPDLTCKVMKGTRRAKCIQEENNLPTIKKQVTVSRDCTELECEDGYNCKLFISRRTNRNILPVATCVPTECPMRRKPRPPMSCTEIECLDDEVCVVCGKGVNTRARCINTTMQDNVVQSDDTEVTVQGRPPISCDELICEPLEVEKCQELTLDNGRNQRALCIPIDAPENCQDAQCDNETETCLELEDGTVKTAVCIPIRTSTLPTTSTNEVVTRPININQPRIIQSVRHPQTPAQSCEQLDCGRDSECLQMINNGVRRAMCKKLRKNEECVVEGEKTVSKSTPTVHQNLPDTCQERRCCTGETCIIQRNVNGDSSVAVCAPVNAEENQPAVVRPLTCEELMCVEGSECIIKQGEGGGEGRRGAVCKRNRVDLPDTLSPDGGERTRSDNRRRPSKVSGGRSSSN